MMFEDEYPKKDMLDSAEALNKDGGGFSWIDSAKGTVRWEKGMHVTSQFIMDTIERENVQLPIIIHFRIATHGGVNNELCHPFAVSAENNEDLEPTGQDTEGVLFHNGVWSDWNSVAMKVLLNDKETKLPSGNFSDSRMMAWLIRHLGNNYLQLIDEKVALMTPNGIIRYGKGWSMEGKVDCSNTHWKWRGQNNKWSSTNSKGSSQSTTINDYLSSKEDAQDFQGCVPTHAKGKGTRSLTVTSVDATVNSAKRNARRNKSVEEGEEVSLIGGFNGNTFSGTREEYDALFNSTNYRYQDYLDKCMRDGKIPKDEDVECGTGFVAEDGTWHEFEDYD
jgi:hypothetical protein